MAVPRGHAAFRGVARGEDLPGRAAGRPRRQPIAAKAEVHPATVKRRLAERRAGKGAPAKPIAATIPSPPLPGPAPPAGRQALEAQAAAAPPASDRRASLLALLAETLDAAPELVVALPLDAVELGRRLADAGLLDGDLDPLAILGRVQGRLERDMATLKVDQVAARKGVAQTLTQIASTAERIKLGRPSDTDPPEVIAERIISERRSAAVAKVFEHVQAREGQAA